MHKGNDLNPTRKIDLQRAIAERDGLNCYICGKPWHDGMTEAEVIDLARRKKIIIPKSWNGSKYQRLVELDTLAFAKLVVEHKNNLSGDEIDNLGLAHQSCNLHKEKVGAWSKSPKFLQNKKMKKYTARARSRRKEDENAVIRVESKTMKRNMAMEPMFERAGSRLLAKHDAIPVEEFIAAACQDAADGEETISPEAAKRNYYPKRSSAWARKAIWEEFEIEKDGLKIRMVRMKEKKP